MLSGRNEPRFMNCLSSQSLWWSLQFQRTTQTFSGIKHLPHLPKSLPSVKKNNLGGLLPMVMQLVLAAAGLGARKAPPAAYYQPYHSFLFLSSASITYGSQICAEMSLSHPLPVTSLCRPTLVCPN